MRINYFNIYKNYGIILYRDDGYFRYSVLSPIDGKPFFFSNGKPKIPNKPKQPNKYNNVTENIEKVDGFLSFRKSFDKKKKI